MKTKFTLVLLFLLACNFCYSATLKYRWKGGTGNGPNVQRWEDKTNWELLGNNNTVSPATTIPTINDIVTIPAGVAAMPQIVSGVTANCKTINVDAGASITILGGLTTNSHFTLDGVCNSNGSITIGGDLLGIGSLSNTGAGTLSISGNYTFSGSFTNSSSSQITFSNNLTNNGTITNSGTLKFSRDIVCNGKFTSSGSVTVSGKIQGSSTCTFSNSGSLSVTGDYAADGYFINSGSIQTTVGGNFTCDANVTNNGSMKISRDLISNKLMDLYNTGILTITGKVNSLRNITNTSTANFTIGSDLIFYGILNNSANTNPLKVSGNFTCKSTGSVINTGTINITLAWTNDGLVNNAGTITVGTVCNNTNDVINSGVFTISGAATFDKTLQNSGNLTANQKVDLGGSATNTGTMQVVGIFTVNGSFKSTQTFTNNDDFICNGTATFAGTVNLLNNNDLIIKNNGTLYATCSLTVPKATTCDGTFYSTSSFSVSGNYSSNGGSCTIDGAIDINGDFSCTGNGTFVSNGSCNMNGLATFDGKIENYKLLFINKDVTTKNNCKFTSNGICNLNGALVGTGLITANSTFTVKNELTNSGNAKWTFNDFTTVGGVLTVDATFTATSTLTLFNNMVGKGIINTSGPTKVLGTIGAPVGTTPNFSGTLNISSDFTAAKDMFIDGKLNHNTTLPLKWINGGSKLGGTGKYNRLRLYLVAGAQCNVVNNVDSIYSIESEVNTKFDIKDVTVQILNSIILAGKVKVIGDTTTQSRFKMNNSTVRFYGTKLQGFADNYIYDKGIFDFASDSRNNSQGVVPCTYWDLKVSNITGQTVRIGETTSDLVYVKHNFSVVASPNISNTLAFLASELKVEGTLAIDKTCTLDTYNQVGPKTPASVSDITVWGDWVNNGNFVARSSNVKMDGGKFQSIAGTTTTSFFKLTLSNSHKDITLKVNTVAGFNDGTIANAGIGGLIMDGDNVLLNGYTLTIAESSAAGIVNIDGYIISEDVSLNAKGQANNASRVCWKIGNNNENHVIPFGYRNKAIPFEIKNTNSAKLGDMTVATYRANFGGHTGSRADSLYPMPNKVKHLNTSGIGGNSNNSRYMVKRFWQIDRSNGLGVPNVTIKFTYTEAEGDERPEDNTGGREKDLRAQRYDTLKNAWEPIWPFQVNDESANTVIVSNLYKFSPWAITKAISPLPVTLTSLNAKEIANEQATLVEWTTASEFDFDHFEVERVEGDHFKTIGTIKGNGNVSTAKKYQFKDMSAAKGWNTYRLKILNTNGSFEYSNLTSVLLKLKDEVKIYPNPAIESLNIDGLQEGSTVEIYGMDGRLVKSEFYNQNVNVQALPAGRYLLNILNANGLPIKANFVKQ